MRIIPWIVLFVSGLVFAQPPATYRLDRDWLLEPAAFAARVERPTAERWVLKNGLVRRDFLAGSTLACTGIEDEMTGRSLLRSVRPEARVDLDGSTILIGGIGGARNHAYTSEVSISDVTPAVGGPILTAIRESRIEARFAWKRVRHHAPDARWPAPGVAIHCEFRFPEESPWHGVVFTIHHELYDGVPLFGKWLSVVNETSRSLDLDTFTAEILAVVPREDPVETRPGVRIEPPSSLHVETDYAFQGFDHAGSSAHTVHWVPDPEFATQVNYERTTPALLEVRPRRGPDQTLQPGGRFESFRIFELVQDSEDRERRGLALRRMYRTIAPWVTENPLILHVVSVEDEIVRAAIDQAAECGFEMVSLSFGSGLDMSDVSPSNLAKFRDLATVAAGRGIHLGGYSLLSSRRIGGGMDVVSPPGESPTHGSCPALASAWGLDHLRRLRTFHEETGFLQFTHDGSYPGDFDVTPRPPLQKGLDDSQWVQWTLISDHYRWLRSRGVYLRVPDYYFLVGSNQCGMGYRETNWSLPRSEQQIHTRQNIFDGTWEKTPSMGWMFVPLTQYHGGGAAATIEPLRENLDHYETMLASNLLCGVQAVYRGLRLYDTPETRDVVTRMVRLFLEHREVLERDVLHLWRADGRRIDGMLHVNPRGQTRAFLALFNPTAESRTEDLVVPLYYAGLSARALISRRDGKPEDVALDAYHRARVRVTIPAGGYEWITFR